MAAFLDKNGNPVLPTLTADGAVQVEDVGSGAQTDPAEVAVILLRLIHAELRAVRLGQEMLLQAQGEYVDLLRRSQTAGDEDEE